jgi:hypothetical protein
MRTPLECARTRRRVVVVVVVDDATQLSLSVFSLG